MLIKNEYLNPLIYRDFKTKINRFNYENLIVLTPEKCPTLLNLP